MFKDKPELAELYSEIIEKMKDFRENIFLKHINKMDTGCVSYIQYLYTIFI